MKIEEAKKIVNYILDWQFVLMGVKERSEITEKMDLSKYSLSDLLKANKIVQSDNRRKEKVQEYHREKGHKTNGITINMILADRLAAAVYTAIHFTPNGEAIALMHDVVVGCVRARYETNQKDQ